MTYKSLDGLRSFSQAKVDGLVVRPTWIWLCNTAGSRSVQPCTTPEAWGTNFNPECKLLLLTYAFEVMKANRVALLTDALNVRSRAAIAKLGAKQEGVLRLHMMTQGDRIRDSVAFNNKADEWPSIQG